MGLLREYINSCSVGFDVEEIECANGEGNDVKGTDRVGSWGDRIEGVDVKMRDGTASVLASTSLEASDCVRTGVFRFFQEAGASLVPFPESPSRLRTLSSCCICSSITSEADPYNFNSLSK